MYIPISVHQEFRPDQALKLTEIIDTEFTKETKSIVVYGQSGTGKTSFALNVCQEYWNGFSSISTLPIYIFLPHLKLPSIVNVETILEAFVLRNWEDFKNIGCSVEQIVDGILEFSVILILDGYDELPGGSVKLFEGRFPLSKFLVITFSQATVFKNKSQRQACFSYAAEENVTIFPKEYFMCPFNKSQINLYVKQFTQVLRKFDPVSDEFSEARDIWLLTKSVTNGTGWEQNEGLYMHWLTNKLPELYSLSERPYILTLILHVLPCVVQKQENHETSLNDLRKFISTEVGIYDEFTREWFAFQTKRIEQRKEPKDLYDVIEQLPAYFLAYAQNLASNLVIKRSGMNLYKGTYDPETLDSRLSQPTDPDFIQCFKEDSKHKIFFVQAGESKLRESEEIIERKRTNLAALRRACLLTVTFIPSHQKTAEEGLRELDRYFTFTHHSLLEYFASREMFQKLRAEFNYYIRENLSISSEYLGFNRRGIEEMGSGIVSQLVGRVKMDSGFEDLLFSVVEKSAEYGIIRQMAANAMTLLNLGGKCLSGRNFRNIQVCGANLSRSIISNSDFRGANLSQVRLQSCCLANSQFQGCNFEEVKYGQCPSIVHHYASAGIYQFIILSHVDHSTGQEYIVTSYADGDILKDSMERRLNSKSEKFIQQPISDFPDRLYGSLEVFVSPKSLLVGYKPDKNKIHFWDFQSTQFVSSIDDIQKTLKERAQSNWLTFKSENQQQVPDTNFDENSICFLWNMPEESIIITSARRVGSTLDIIRVFPSNLEVLLNCQIQSEDEHGVDVLSYSEFGDSVLLAIRTSTSFQILKPCPLSHEISTIFVPERNCEYFSVVISPNQEYVAYSMNDKFGRFKLYSFSNSSIVINEEGYLAAGTVVITFGQQFVFNTTSTLLATQFEHDRFINIWKLAPQFEIYYQVQDFSSHVRYARPTAQFTFCNGGQSIAYYGTPAGSNSICIVELESREVAGPREEAREIQDLYVSSDFSYAATTYPGTTEINVFSVPALADGSLYSRFNWVRSGSEHGTSISKPISSIGFWSQNSTNYRLLILEFNGLLSLCTLHGKMLAAIRLIDGDGILPSKSSFDLNRCRIYLVQDQQLVFLNIQVNSIGSNFELAFTKVESQGRIQNYNAFFYSSDETKWVGVRSSGLTVCNFSLESPKLITVAVPRDSRTLMDNMILDCCFGNHKGHNSVKIFCSTVAILFVYQVERGQKIVLKRRIPLPWGLSMSIYNTGIRFVPTLNKLVLTYANGDLRIIEPKTGRLVLFTTVWHSIYRTLLRMVPNTERVEVLLSDSEIRDGPTCVSIGKNLEDWSIVWSRKRSTALLATSSNFNKSLSLDQSSQVLLIGQGQGSGEPRRGIYVPFLDWFKGIKGEEVGPSMRPVFQDKTKPEFRIDKDFWSVCVRLRKSSLRLSLDIVRDLSINFHTSLLIEGIQLCQRFVIKADLSIGDGISADEVVIKTEAITSVDRLSKLATNSQCQTFKIGSETGLRLLMNIQSDQLGVLKYNWRTRNCNSWCKDKLKQVGINIPDHWSDMLVVLPTIITRVD